jgi:hypothetical protein
MSLPDPIALERLRYEQGQQLRSRDRRDQVAIEAQLRWWHNRGVHNAFGVAEGLDVEPIDGVGAVEVRPGLAYDCRGRELILQRPRKVPLPPAREEGAEDFLLVARYRESSDYPRRGDRAGVCVPGGRYASLLLESPRLEWIPKRAWTPEQGVPLAGVRLTGAGPEFVEGFVRPRARARARPLIATGSTLPGATAWQVWEEFPNGQQGRAELLGFQVEVDTSSAGFVETPCYFAWLRGSLWNQPPQVFVVAPFQHIANPSRNGFTFRLFLPAMSLARINVGGSVLESNLSPETKFLPFAERKRLYVYWIGIQEAPTLKAADGDKGGAKHGHS